MSYQEITTSDVAPRESSLFFRSLPPVNDALKAQKRITNTAVDFARAGRVEEAIAMLEEALAAHPDNIYFLGQLGHLYRRSGNLEAARDCMERGRQLCPTDIKTLSSLGAVCAAMGDYARAETVLEEASRLNRDDMFAVVSLSNVLIQQDKLEQAAELLSESGGIERGNKYIITSYGIVLSMQDRLVEARDLLEQGHSLHSRDPYIVNLLGMVCSELGDYAAAEDILVRANRLDPRNRFIAATLGNVYLRQRKLGEAERVLKITLRSNPRDVVLLNLLGTVFLRQGNVERAEIVLGDALRIAPANIAAITTLGHIYLNQQNYVEFDRLVGAFEIEDDDAFIYLLAKNAFLRNKPAEVRSLCKTLFTLRGYDQQIASLYLACAEQDDEVTRKLETVFDAQQFMELKQCAADLIRNPAGLDRFDSKANFDVSAMLGENFTTRKVNTDALSRAVAASILVAMIAGHIAYRGILGSFNADPGILGLSSTAIAACVLSLVSRRSQD
jgi:tetratricopeptide (TPR) repeat protein